MKEWEKNIRKVTPYIPGEQPKMDYVVKLNTNECPYPPSPMVEQAIKDLDYKRFRLYPDPDATELVRAIADYEKVPEERVFVGVGSDDVLGMAFLTFFHGEKPVLMADITYSFYDVWANLFQIPFETIPLNAQLEIVPEEFCRENGGVVFPNPNAPTAIEMPLSQVEKIIRKNQDVVVIVDEAYIDFGGTSALRLTEKYDNLLVVRTFSKSRAMAGMRIGYAIGSETLISALKAVKFSYNSYTMNQAAMAAGIAAIRDEKYFNQTIEKIISTRERAKKVLSDFGFFVTDSKTNFLFATHKTMEAKDIFEQLRDRHIFVRFFDKPRINQYLRITIGTDEEMEILYQALREILK